jgi:hypothetical protein
MSLLNKLPADVDSRVFWSVSVRDSLFGRHFLFAEDMEIDAIHFQMQHTVCFACFDPCVLSYLYPQLQFRFFAVALLKRSKPRSSLRMRTIRRTSSLTYSTVRFAAKVLFE